MIVCLYWFCFGGIGGIVLVGVWGELVFVVGGLCFVCVGVGVWWGGDCYLYFIEISIFGVCLVLWCLLC